MRKTEINFTQSEEQTVLSFSFLVVTLNWILTIAEQTQTTNMIDEKENDKKWSVSQWDRDKRYKNISYRMANDNNDIHRINKQNKSNEEKKNTHFWHFDFTKIVNRNNKQWRHTVYLFILFFFFHQFTNVSMDVSSMKSSVVIKKKKITELSSTTCVDGLHLVNCDSSGQHWYLM